MALEGEELLYGRHVVDVLGFFGMRLKMRWYVGMTSEDANGFGAVDTVASSQRRVCIELQKPGEDCGTFHRRTLSLACSIVRNSFGNYPTSAIGI